MYLPALETAGSVDPVAAQTDFPLGHGELILAGEGALEGVSVFLNKPYTAKKLLNTLAEVLRRI